MCRVGLGNTAEVADPAKVNADAFAPDLWVSIAPDGTVTVLAHRSEMGTGIRTGLPRVLADELEADWSRVVIRQAQGDKRLGDQNTDGSNSIRFFFDTMRTAGAIARTMLERAAAQAVEGRSEANVMPSSIRSNTKAPAKRSGSANLSRSLGSWTFPPRTA